MNGSWYYYIDGYKTMSDWVTDKSGRYYVDAEGKMLAGLQTVEENTYYFNEKHRGTYGAVTTGWVYLDGAYYYFDTDGPMVVSDWRYDGSHRFYLGEDGKMYAGLQTVGDAVYYFNEKHSGTYGAVTTGWVYLDGYYYFFESDGAMAANTWKKDSSGSYYLGEDGRMLTGWQTVDGASYYFKEDHNGAYGAMATGWAMFDGAYYYFDTDGAMVTSDWHIDGSGKYYLGEDGKMVTGWRTLDDTTYYFRKRHDGSYGAACDRPTYIAGDMYMFGTDGALMTNTTVKRLGTTWNVNEDGIIEGYVTDAGRTAAGVLDQIGWNLRAAFNWSARLRYANRWLRAPSGSVHMEWYANYGFEHRYGNCFVMNSTLYQMIKMMGYDVYFVEGGVLNSNGYLAPHGWNEVIHDGVLYVYDANFTNETGMNGFRIRYGQSGTWHYAGYKRVDRVV